MRLPAQKCALRLPDQANVSLCRMEESGITLMYRMPIWLYDDNDWCVWGTGEHASVLIWRYTGDD